ncbi:MAG: thermonuclease family protein [Anaerolineae bacterium]|nr:thermonuclease family protein [Anaerolineae bacterium]
MKDQPSRRGCLASGLGFIILALIIIGPKLLRAVEGSSQASHMRTSIDELTSGPSVQEVTVVRPYVSGIGIANDPYPITVNFIGAEMCTECPGWNEQLRDLAIAEVARLTTGRTVRIEFDVQRTSAMVGNWPHVLAYVWADDVLLNVEMVHLGYLVVGDFGPNTRYQEILLEAERQAKAARVGIWAQSSAISTPQE